MDLFTCRTDRKLLRIAIRYPAFAAERCDRLARHCRFNDLLFADVMCESLMVARIQLLTGLGDGLR